VARKLVELAGRPARRVNVAPDLRPGHSGRRLRWLWLLVAGLALGLLSVGANSAFLVYQFQHSIYHPLPGATVAEGATPVTSPVPAQLGLQPPAIGTSTPTPTQIPTQVPAALPAGRINILVLGTDKRPEQPADGSRSDTLIVLSIDSQTKTAGILSVPRDLQVAVPGYGLQKINAAYFYGEHDHLPGGGPGLAMATVSQYFNVPVQYYISINFSGFEKVIDMVGGIDVYVPTAIDDPLYPGPNNSYIHVHFDPGLQHLDGVRALEYARTRHSDSDFGRNRRQQQVIQALRARVLQLDMVPRLPMLLGELAGAIETNIPPDQQMLLAQLGGQIPQGNLYTAQIDSTLVYEIAGTSNLQLNRAKAQPMLDRFFGR
jgi:LCP family protein required for cell wall assembly